MKKGYKNTEIGIIPEDWGIVWLDAIADIITGNKDTQDKIDDGKYPFYVRSEIIERINTYSFDKEAVLTSGDGVGVGKIFHYVKGRFDFHQRVYCIHNFKNYNGKLFYYIFSQHFFNRVMQMTAKSSVDSVRREMIARMKLPLPPLPEQQAIAEVLSDTDALIQNIKQLISKKKALKQGAMQQLLTDKRRLKGFKEKWEVKKLGEVVDFFKGQGLSKSKLNVNGEFCCILYGELFTTYKEVIDEVINKTNYNEGILSKKGDVLIPASTTTNGIDLCIASCLNKDNVLLGGDINILRPKIKINSEFLSAYLTNVKKYDIEQETQGITIIHLYGKRLKNIEIILPPLSEQQAIAKILSDMDKEIVNLEEQLHKTEALKQGMMQELLTGKTRIV